MNERFFWGAATAAHQVEGGNNNDWTKWEQHNAKRLALIAKRNPPTGGWPDYILKNYPTPLQEENYISGKACDHYNHFKEDFDIAKKLGHNANRFSIEWSRIEPEEGKFDACEIEHYRKVVRALRKRELEPFVTLWHFALPLWLRDKGGAACPEFPKYFARYAELISHELSDVRFWLTLNEANFYTGSAYFRGVWPPNERSLRRYLLTNYRLSRSHIAAYRAIKTARPDSQIGIAQNFVWFASKFSGIKRFIYNRFFLDLIGAYQDFIGINYYRSDRKNAERSEFNDWSIDPEGLYFVLKEAARYKKPIYITENGTADARDVDRELFIAKHISWMKKAMDEGADVRGYFYWSLLDNFEWDKGFWPRFGLVEVDYKTMKRKVRPSALIYKKIIENWSC